MTGWDEQGRWTWGRNGERLDPAEVKRRHRARIAERNRAKASHELELARAETLYRGGHLSPWRITMALDAEGLEGPDVDTACGAEEPDVDLWEAGVLYPTWEQVQKLAALCKVTPRFLMDDAADGTKMRYADTTLRFHAPIVDVEIVERFRPEAIRDRLRPLADTEP